MAKYRSNYVARALITQLLEDMGVRQPERRTIDRWAGWYEQFLWATLSNDKAWLRTLSLALDSGDTVHIEKPAKMVEWLVEHGDTEKLPLKEVSRFTETLRKIDPNWRTQSVHKSVLLEFEQRRPQIASEYIEAPGSPKSERSTASDARDD